MMSFTVSVIETSIIFILSIHLTLPDNYCRGLETLLSPFLSQFLSLLGGRPPALLPMKGLGAILFLAQLPSLTYMLLPLKHPDFCQPLEHYKSPALLPFRDASILPARAMP